MARPATQTATDSLDATTVISAVHEFEIDPLRADAVVARTMSLPAAQLTCL